jgi:hypothetical protein
VILAGAQTVIDFNNILFDGLNEFNLVTDRFTPREAGFYLLIAATRFTHAFAGSQMTLIVVNNIPLAVVADSTRTVAGVTYLLECSTIRYLTPNDWIEVRINNGDGINNLTVTGGGPEVTFFTSHRLS